MGKQASNRRPTPAAVKKPATHIGGGSYGGPTPAQGLKPCGQRIPSASQLSRQVFKYMNDYREKKGKPKLAWSARIANHPPMAAHAEWYGNLTDGRQCLKENAHRDLDGRGGVVCGIISGENVCQPHSFEPDAARTAIDMLKTSPGHHWAMLAPFTQCGVVSYLNRETGLWTVMQVFGGTVEQMERTYGRGRAWRDVLSNAKWEG